MTDIRKPPYTEEEKAEIVQTVLSKVKPEPETKVVAFLAEIGPIHIRNGRISIETITIDFRGQPVQGADIVRLIKAHVVDLFDKEIAKLDGVDVPILIDENKEITDVSLTENGMVKTADVIDLQARKFWEDKQ